MTAVSLHPRRALGEGRYLLDDAGRLQPLRPRGFVRVVAIVTVRAKAGAAAPPTRPDVEIAPESSPESFGADLAVRLPARAKPTNWARVAAAHRARPSGPPAKKPPTRRALGPGECGRCGIPGFRGCDHFLPYQPGDTA